MADSIMINVKDDFDMGIFMNKLCDTYRMKGYSVPPIPKGANSVRIGKGESGITKIAGMSEGVTVSVTQTGSAINIAFLDPEWTSKIIACVVGLFCFWVPFITGIIGVVRQNNLPKSIAADAQMIVSGM